MKSSANSPKISFIDNNDYYDYYDSFALPNLRKERLFSYITRGDDD